MVSADGVLRVRQDIKKAFTITFSQGGTVVGADEVPVGTPDYSSFILKIGPRSPMS